MADLFVNEAFGILDKFNGGFLKGSRTADNISIFKTLIQRQLLNGENCLCTLSISRTLSTELIGIFYSISYSIRGSTDASLKPYIHKTYFRLNVQGKLRPCVFDSLGVNQGGIASNVLFLCYMADPGEYLNKNVGVSIEDIIVHLLWADDLIWFQTALQQQLNITNIHLVWGEVGYVPPSVRCHI